MNLDSEFECFPFRACEAAPKKLTVPPDCPATAHEPGIDREKVQGLYSHGINNPSAFFTCLANLLQLRETVTSARGGTSGSHFVPSSIITSTSRFAAALYLCRSSSTSRHTESWTKLTALLPNSGDDSST